MVHDLLKLLLMAAITSAQITFIHMLFWDGMILRFFKENKLPRFIQKPLYDCLICMTSIWGFFFWIAEWNASVNLFWFWFLVGGINVLISGIVGRAEDYNGESFVLDRYPHSHN